MSRTPLITEEITELTSIRDIGIIAGASLDSSQPGKVFLVIKKHNTLILDHEMTPDDADALANILEIYAYAARRQGELDAKR